MNHVRKSTVLDCRRRSAKYRRRDGALLVEFAVTLPIVLLLMGGLFEISRVLLFQHTADTAAYEGARSAMVPGATAQEGRREAEALLEAAGLVDCTVSIQPETITEETATITVKAEVPVAPNQWVFPTFFNEVSVQSEVTLVAERPPVVRLSGVPELKKKLKEKREEKSGKGRGRNRGRNRGRGEDD